MAVTMKQVRATLDPEEPDYDQVAKLGAGALPHLEALVNSGDTMLASKAAYAAGLIKSPKSAEVVDTAAHSDDPAVRVAAAAAASNLPAKGASAVLSSLIGDPDPGVRKVAREAVPDSAPAELMQMLEEAGEEAGEPEMDEGSAGAAVGPMPGEAEAEPGAVGQTMPGEQPGGMPGEQQKMPGEA
jgi:HEAT repeats